jgi:hypothetical protein
VLSEIESAHKSAVIIQHICHSVIDVKGVSCDRHDHKCQQSRGKELNAIEVRDGYWQVVSNCVVALVNKSQAVYGVMAGLLKEPLKEARAKRKWPTAENANVAVLMSI